MEKGEEFITVTMTINTSKYLQMKGKWHIKFDRDIVQLIEQPIFAFSSTSMNVAITKVSDLVSRHAENFFKEITIK